MVRFSDMLGGSGEPDDANAADSPYAALASDEADAQLEDEADEPDEAAGADAVKEPVPVATFETPEAVLDRLTQYATSRAADQTQAEPDAEPEPQLEAEPDAELEAEPDAELEAEPDAVLPPVGDDFLPKFEGLDRKPGRGRRRHP
jgi:hypothetical protein